MKLRAAPVVSSLSSVVPSPGGYAPVRRKNPAGNAAGRGAVCATFGVKESAISKAIQKGYLPAPWFNGLERLTGQTLPRHLFSFKGSSK